MRPWAVALVAALVVPQPSLARDSAQIPLNRIGKWEVSYEPDACHLAARFGTGKQELIARFTQFQPGDSFDLGLFGEPVKLSGPGAEVKISFGLAAEPSEAHVVLGNAGKMPMMLFSNLRLDGFRWPENAREPFAVPTISPEQESRVTGATLRLSSNRNYRLETGAMDKPMAAMRTCLANLVKYWGYDPAVQQGLTRAVTPINSPGSWLVSDDYPSEALGNGSQGLVQFRLDVSATGVVSACHVLYKTSPDEFADVTCRNVTRRAKLLPALDAKGAAVRSFYIQNVRWQIPY